MSGAFPYKPKFVDIRVRPPKSKEQEAAEADVHHLKPGERPCDWPECRAPANCRAPKSREIEGENYWFCQPHAAEYNRNWNFFSGMSEGEQARFREEALTGHRPTWAFKASKFSREAASVAARGAAGADDPLGLLSAARSRAAHAAAVAPAARKLGRLEARALAELDLDGEADAAAVRARYLEYVKKFHPDANGGDRTSEDKLTRVIRAFKALQKAKMA